jgi:hypothetical protein
VDRMKWGQWLEMSVGPGHPGLMGCGEKLGFMLWVLGSHGEISSGAGERAFPSCMEKDPPPYSPSVHGIGAGVRGYLRTRS